jgi:hypothetical protein
MCDALSEEPPAIEKLLDGVWMYSSDQRRTGVPEVCAREITNATPIGFRNKRQRWVLKVQCERTGVIAFRLPSAKGYKSSG